jgi:cytochrome c551/c552/mono/diheme cytochrome c family protein
MSTSRSALARVALVAALLTAHAASAQTTPYPGIGRPATAKELAAWDIDVRPDFKGLPAGSGSVAKGQDVWEAKCASCHGVFGESNEVFNPIVGGTTKEDIASGRVAKLRDPAFPGRTTLMKVSSVSTLWDYINRAMPWNQPKTLSVEEVYAVTAFILNLGGVVPDDFVLSDRNIAEAQKRLPNRNGKTLQHAMWPGTELKGQPKPDVQGSTCMTNCATEPKVASILPDFARNAHGNLADQNRLVGAQRGANTAGAAVVASAAATPAPPKPAGALALAQTHACTACHSVDAKLVGPSFRDIAGKYAGRADAAAYLAGRMKTGGSGTWGSIPMPPQNLPDGDAKVLAQWLADGAPR